MKKQTVKARTLTKMAQLMTKRFKKGWKGTGKLWCGAKKNITKL